MIKYFVTFYSPGTFVSEEDEHEIDSWDVKEAVKLSKDITQRYGAKPYGFRFSVRSRGPNDLDSKVTKTSGMYYLGGEVFTLEQIKARNNPKDQILIDNMRFNNIKRIVENRNSYLFTGALDDDDVVLDMNEFKTKKKVNLRK
jgi:hypothetical protein